MKISVVVFDRGELSELDTRMVCASANSVRLAGAEPSRATPKESIQVSLGGAAEYCHFLEAGTVVLPSFYKAATMAMAQHRTDYAYCWCAKLGNGRVVQKVISPDDLVLGQVLIKAWVVAELASKDKHPLPMLSRALNEYRGTEVPHVMTMEILP